jgi:ferredoxin
MGAIRFLSWRRRPHDPVPMPYRIKINRSLCTGYAECVGLAPEVFQLGTDNVSVVVDPEGGDDEMILDAARACPVDAITLIDEFEDQVWPQ